MKSWVLCSEGVPHAVKRLNRKMVQYEILLFWSYFIILMLSGHIKQVWGAKPNFSLEPRGHLNPLSAMSPENFRAPYFSHRKSIENCVELKFGWCRVPLVIYSLCNFQLDWTSINGSNLHAKVQMVRNQQNGPAGRGLTSMNLKLWPQMLSDVNETHFPCKLCIFKSFVFFFVFFFKSCT